MSYILDALKRADAERERGHVPGLHTRTTPELDAPAAASGSLGQRGRLLALGTLLVLGAVLWWWLRAAPPVAPVILAAAPATQAPATLSSPVPSEPIQLPESAGSRRNVASETAPPVLPILSPPPAPPPAPAKAAAASPPTIPPADAQRAPSDPDSAAAAQKNSSNPAPGGAPVAAAVAVAIQSFAELSPEARARLPAVNVSGSTYSKNPTLRMLIVNGKVVQEGSEIAPGLSLETIEPRSAVLNHQGLRYRIGY